MDTDADAPCGVCGDVDAGAGVYQMLYCDGCNVCLHLACYGMRRLPREKAWFCDACRQGFTDKECVLCRVLWRKAPTSPAMVSTGADDGKSPWAHAVCVRANDMAALDGRNCVNLRELEPDFDSRPSRSAPRCSFCNRQSGQMVHCECAQCCRVGHASCALQAGRLRLTDADGPMFYCNEHADERQDVCSEPTGDESDDDDVGTGGSSDDYAETDDDSDEDDTSSESGGATTEDSDEDDTDTLGITGDISAMTISSSIQFRPGKASGARAGAPPAMKLYRSLATRVDRYVSSAIASANAALFAAVTTFVTNSRLMRHPAELQTAVIQAGVNRADNALLFHELASHLLRAGMQVCRVAPTDSCSNVVDLMWTVYESLRVPSLSRSSSSSSSAARPSLRPRAESGPVDAPKTPIIAARPKNKRPDEQLAKAASSSLLAIIVDSVESVPQGVLNAFIQRLTTLSTMASTIGLALIVGVSSSVHVLEELLWARTTQALSMQVFPVAPALSFEAPFLDHFVCADAFPVQLGPRIVEQIRYRFRSSNTSIRGLAADFRLAILLHIRARPDKACEWAEYVAGDADSELEGVSPRNQGSARQARLYRSAYWRTIRLVAAIVSGTGSAQPSPSLLLDLYGELANGSASTPILDSFFKSVESVDKALRLTTIVRPWTELLAIAPETVDLADQLQQVLFRVENPGTDGQADADLVGRMSQKFGRQSKRLFTTQSSLGSSLLKQESVKREAVRVVGLLKNMIAERLRPIPEACKQVHNRFFFDDVSAFQQLFPGSLERNALAKFRACPDSDIAVVWGFIREAHAITVHMGQLFSKFKVMQHGNPDEVKARFVQAIEDLCVIGFVCHSTHPACVERIVHHE
ncbi:unnamed protein product (mitochondrion) [Plasmodiophora brassicae]|uniref:PHD-type domain-containing protein n=1 Tax=Plasmodiophora brassicae TaxID=37360 RepID=A0A0G4ITW7_PLABS|nr:hypothetical protein PBRA_006766 [Plasmodiophora brassicae]SPR00790.1 unnamed protein product [Plasmodiophora brassicae]